MQTISKYVIAFIMLLSTNYIEDISSDKEKQAAIPVETLEIKLEWKCPSAVPSKSNRYNYS